MSLQKSSVSLSAGLVCWLLAGLIQTAAEVPFVLPMSFPVGGDAYSAITGDFNGDGKPDIATANHAGNVSILLGNGDNTFQLPITSPAGRSAMALTSGDFNHDGKLDLVMSDNEANQIVVLLGNGDGTFQASVDYPVTFAPTSIVVADFDGDGTPDVAAAPISLADAVAILWGKGDGTFSDPKTFPTAKRPGWLAVGDFNGDGKTDLVVGNEGANHGTISVLLNNGDRTFQHFKKIKLETLRPRRTLTVPSLPLQATISGLPSLFRSPIANCCSLPVM